MLICSESAGCVRDAGELKTADHQQSPPAAGRSRFAGVKGRRAGAPAPIVLILFFVFSFFNAGYNTLTNVYPGEVLPTEIRGIGTGFAAAISRVGAGILPCHFLYPCRCRPCIPDFRGAWSFGRWNLSARWSIPTVTWLAHTRKWIMAARTTSASSGTLPKPPPRRYRPSAGGSPSTSRNAHSCSLRQCPIHPDQAVLYRITGLN